MIELLANGAAVQSAPPAWQWWATAVAIIAAMVSLFGLVPFSQAGMIARATRKEAVRQPVFLLLLAIAALVLLVNTWLPFFSFGDDVKMLKDCGLATILICGLLLAVWTASTSIADEIEGKTAMTVLSKPVNRRQFVVGKYVGILQAMVFFLLPLMMLLLVLIYYKVGYDAREAARTVPPFLDWERAIRLGPLSVPRPNAERMAAVIQILPGLVLITLEVAVLSGISVAISTRLPMIVNIVSCLAIFIVGHLTPVLVEAGAFRIEYVAFMARLIATLLPTLEMFNMQTAVATGTLVPPVYLGAAALYCLVYSMATVLVAFLLFEDRDLA